MFSLLPKQVFSLLTDSENKEVVDSLYIFYFYFFLFIAAYVLNGLTDFNATASNIVPEI